MTAVIGMQAMMSLLLSSVKLSAVGQTPLARQVTYRTQAPQDTQAGIADYQSRLGASAGGWAYALGHCSAGSFSACTTTPDSADPAFSGVPDTSCTTSAATATRSTPGDPGYFGWVVTHGSTSGYNEEYQYVVDSAAATATGGAVRLWVTGRAGTSGRYTCTTEEVDIAGPTVETVSSLSLLPPAACTGTPQPVTLPSATSGATYVEIQATGGAGAAGA